VAVSAAGGSDEVWEGADSVDDLYLAQSTKLTVQT